MPVVWKRSVGSDGTTGSEDGATSSPPKTETYVTGEGTATPRSHGFLSITASHSTPHAKTQRVENIKGNTTHDHGLLFVPAPRSTKTKGLGNIKGNATRVPPSIHLVVIPFMQYSNTDRAILAREKEYKTALRRNLNHPLVSGVHVLTTNTQQTLEHFGELLNQSKLVVSEVKSVDFMRDALDYISQKLLGKDVMFSNADIYLGSGFDGVDSILMSQQKIIYALTRRVAKEEKCDRPARHLVGVDLCLEKEYWGSHDAFLFRVTEPLPEEILKELEFRLGSPGLENV